ncbi:hypothetical protein BDM02DRAFT_986867 [Thelephora ganbajun]|uniref:Uncharacterized protein n=1 Tax=Thelephora ganbajun TaxID=370292 RepID=A0ACB6Z502_THEGA|nr:hypothetical protein BDM02DRAFT_986867 [Thelephora ganbajun]
MTNIASPKKTPVSENGWVPHRCPQYARHTVLHGRRALKNAAATTHRNDVKQIHIADARPDLRLKDPSGQGLTREGLRSCCWPDLQCFITKWDSGSNMISASHKGPKNRSSSRGTPSGLATGYGRDRAWSFRRFRCVDEKWLTVSNSYTTVGAVVGGADWYLYRWLVVQKSYERGLTPSLVIPSSKTRTSRCLLLAISPRVEAGNVVAGKFDATSTHVREARRYLSLLDLISITIGCFLHPFPSYMRPSSRKKTPASFVSVICLRRLAFRYPGVPLTRA